MEPDSRGFVGVGDLQYRWFVGERNQHLQEWKRGSRNEQRHLHIGHSDRR